MKTRKLGQDLTVSAVGLGCMGMSFGYGASDENESVKTLHRAVDLGVTFSIPPRPTAPLPMKCCSAGR